MHTVRTELNNLNIYFYSFTQSNRRLSGVRCTVKWSTNYIYSFTAVYCLPFFIYFYFFNFFSDHFPCYFNPVTQVWLLFFVYSLNECQLHVERERETHMCLCVCGIETDLFVWAKFVTFKFNVKIKSWHPLTAFYETVAIQFIYRTTKVRTKYNVFCRKCLVPFSNVVSVYPYTGTRI